MRRKHYDDADDDGCEVKDGEGVRVRLDFADAAVRDYLRRTAVDAAVARHMVGCAHRPGYVQDVLEFSASFSVKDSADLADAFARRQKAFDDLELRSQNAWRQPLNAMSPPPPEPAAQWPDENGNGNGDDDEDNGDDLAVAQRRRDDAYEARNARGDDAWRNPPNPYVGGLSNYGGTLDPRKVDRSRRFGAKRCCGETRQS